MSEPSLDPTLYLVLGTRDVDSRGIDAICKDAVRGGVTLVQLREKDVTTRAFIESARSLRDALSGTGVPLLINDRVDVALAAEVDGVHVGQNDMSVTDVRRLLGNSALVGLTVHNEDEINAAPHDVLDYMSIGGVFVTQSKDNTGTPVGLDGLSHLVRHARRSTAMPLTAIAGINAATAGDVVRCGVDGIAVISAVVAQDSPAEAAQTLRSIITSARQS